MKPKPPKSCYIFYCEATRAALKSEHPDVPVTELAKMQGAKWKELDAEGRKPYMKRAEEDEERPMAPSPAAVLTTRTCRSQAASARRARRPAKSASAR